MDELTLTTWVNAAVNGIARRTAANAAVFLALRRTGRWLAVSGQ